MIKCTIFFLFAVIAWNKNAVAQFQTNSPSVCLLTDAPNQCGSFCLSALRPLLDGLANVRRQLRTMAEIQKDMQVRLARNQEETKEILESIQKGTPSKLTNKENQLQTQANCVREVWGHFTIIKIPKSWVDAEVYCRVMGGHLATFKDKEEFDFITEKIDPSERYWLGINDRARENYFVSVDFGKKVQFFEWGVAEPNDAAEDTGVDEDCVELKNLKMNDSDCNDKHFFICQN
ncbi:hypothetical protein KR084_001439 [Drosophila pseudotakahashii]|nr:hypothetical protein KR084_001439 [Drosophila pseudotakahashii]